MLRRILAALVAVVLVVVGVPPHAAAADSERVAVTADTGFSPALWAAIGAQSPALTVIAGDLGYQAGAEQTYCSQVRASISGPVAILPGNHEGLNPTYGGGDGNILTYARCLGTPDGVQPLFGGYPTDYVIDTVHARIVLISPNIVTGNTSAIGGKLTYADGTAEQAALVRTITDGVASGRWVIVVHHEPSYGMAQGTHAAEPTNLADRTLALAEMRAGAHLVITGHDHAYYRSHQLDAGVAVDRDGAYFTGAGTVFLVTGNGGHKPAGTPSVDARFAAASAVQGFAVLDMTADKLTVTERAVTGGVLDTFSFTRPDPAAQHGYVTAVYRDILGRDPEPAGLDHWTTLLATGLPRVDFTRAVTLSTEHIQHVVAVDYQTLLGRDPEPAGLAHWVAALQAGTTEADLQAQIVASDEYRGQHA